MKVTSDGKSAGSSKPAGAVRKPRRLFLSQRPMRRMVYALIPILIAGVYFFGWRVAALLVVCLAGGLATEWVTASRRGQPITQACFVTCFLYALSLPPTMPFGMALVGVVVGILFGKEVFGGFGKNFANPAIVGRAFVYVAFPKQMTGSFVPAFRGWAGGFSHWSLAGMAKAPEWLSSAAKTGLDAVTAATPAWARRDFGYETPLLDLFLGNIGGTFEAASARRVLAAGSIGEVSALLIAAAGIYLLVTKTANWRLMASPLIAASLMALLLHHVAGIERVPPLPFSLLTGSVLYGAVFMVTEPVSAPKKRLSVWVYGLFIGCMIMLLRWKGQFAGSVSFSILLGNIVAPSLDMAVSAWEGRKKARQAGSTGAGS